MATTTNQCIFCSRKRCLVLDYKFSSGVDLDWFRGEFDKVARSSRTRILSWSLKGNLMHPKHAYAVLDLADPQASNPALGFVLPNGSGASVTPIAFWHWTYAEAIEAINEGDPGARGGRCGQDK
ncbi:hypothetical protein ASPCAL03223 [Aspergillus calidoustus]|uniref:Uncharacterized protein n=1 Tax=Aspergillus calidoustus TaxID=454130 RepID=A0A0U5GSK8_ASPCI|nr:hypothetical protein ASPCAL03223 [Aspergillus calidoustus]